MTENEIIKHIKEKILNTLTIRKKKQSSSNKYATRIYRPTVLQGRRCKAHTSPEAEKILMGPEKEATACFLCQIV